MEKITEDKGLKIQLAEAQATDQQESGSWRKSIPAQVFLNYFFSINYHIKNSFESGSLHKQLYFLKHHQELGAEETEQIKKHLLKCWNAEYAIRATAGVSDEAYLRNSLHWTFPQAYYSVYAGIQAFLLTHGIHANNSEHIRREIGRLVVKGAYPEALSFYAVGAYDDFRVFRLPLSKYKPGLKLVSKELEAQAQIGQFLRTTRKRRAKEIRQRIQSDPNLAIRNNKTGDILQKFNDVHWNQLTWRIGYTTFFDLMSRLQISATQREIDRFVEADIDFKLFHESLLELVGYINFVHEAYVVKTIGLEAYKDIINELPAYIKHGFVTQRLSEKIEPVLKQIASDHDEHASHFGMSA